MYLPENKNPVHLFASIYFVIFLSDGTNSSTHPWSSASGISPSGHGGMLGFSSSSQSLSGNNGKVPAHDRLVRRDFKMQLCQALEEGIDS